MTPTHQICKNLSSQNAPPQLSRRAAILEDASGIFDNFDTVSIRGESRRYLEAYNLLRPAIQPDLIIQYYQPDGYFYYRFSMIPS
jgi:hypothetical protein